MTDEPRRRSFTAAAALMYGTNVAVAVLSLANVLITARMLGPEGRGDIALLTTIAMLTANLSAFGIHEANANIGGAEPEKRPALATNSLLVSLVFGGIAAGVVALLVGAFPSLGGGTDTTLRWVALGAIPLVIGHAALQYLIQSHYGFGITNAAWLLSPVISVVVNGAFAVFGILSVASVVVVWVAGQALATGLLAWYAAFRLGGFGRGDARLARRSLAFGSRTHMGRVMTMTNYRADQWFVGAIAGTRELGLYSVAVAWAEALFYLPTVLGMVQRPDLVRASRDEAGARAGAVFRAAIILTAVLTVGLVVAAPLLCIGFFGDAFGGSVDDLRVLAFGAFGMVALKLLGSALNAQGKPMLANIGVGVAFVCTITFDVLLIPGHGGLGAAIASTIAYSAGGVVIALVFVRVHRRKPRELVPRRADVRPLLQAIRAR
jgi:O-antigen/teichoic acid export membrane protein